MVEYENPLEKCKRCKNVKTIIGKGKYGKTGHWIISCKHNSCNYEFNPDYLDEIFNHPTYNTLCSLKYSEGKNEMTKLDVKEFTPIPEGKHTGEIVDVVERTEPYAYTDIIVTVDDMEGGITLKCGYPTTVSRKPDGTANSALAKLFTNCGFSLDKSVDTNDLKGVKVSYVTFSKDTDKGTFSEITKASVKKI